MHITIKRSYLTWRLDTFNLLSSPAVFFFICRDLIFLLDPYLFPFPPFPRATASEELEEGPWQVSMVPPEVDEITAEHCPDVKVSSTPKLQW